MKRLRACIVAAALCAAAGPGALVPALAGEFGVSPIRIDLDRATRSSVITVSNDGDTPLIFQIRAFLWTQDGAGQDRYEQTNDLVYFPQQLRIPPKENRVVRLGYRNPATDVEKAYRVFIEEQVEPASGAAGTAASVGVAVRFGVPVFLRPASLAQQGNVSEPQVADGKVSATVRNTGPVHLRINSVRFEGLGAAGEKTFERAVDGWYLLSGAERRYSTTLPADVCRKTALLRVEVIGEKLRFQSESPVPAPSCP